MKISGSTYLRLHRSGRHALQRFLLREQLDGELDEHRVGEVHHALEVRQLDLAVRVLGPIRVVILLEKSVVRVQ